MKPKIALHRTSLFPLAIAALQAVASSIHADTLTWDGAATGNWNTTDANWSGDTWDNTVPDDAIFGLTGEGTVTATEAITAGAVTFTGGAYNFAASGGSLSFTTLNTTGATSVGFDGVLAGSGTITSNVGTTWTGNNSAFNGIVNNSAGNIVVNNANGLGTGTINLSGGALLASQTFNLNSSLIINATGGSIAQSGANRQFGILGTVNFNTGGTGVTLGGQLENRTLFFRNGSTIGGDAANVNISRSSVTIESGVTINYGGSFTLVGTTQTATHFSLLNLGNGIDLSSTGSNNTIILSNVSTSQKIVQAAANGTATVGDIVIQQANNAQARLAAGTNGTLNVNGVISQNAAGRTLNIQGEGTVVLNNANTYTGATNVNAGTLLINGNISTSSLTTVASGATLGGIGTLGALTVQDNGTLAPGTSPGTLSSGTLTLADLSNLNFEINPLDFTTGGGINDLVSVTGNLSLDGILNLTSTSGDFLSAIEGDAWRLFNYSGSLTDNGLALGTMPALGSGLGWDIDTATAGQVNLVVIPEPSVALLGGLGLLALLRRRR